MLFKKVSDRDQVTWLQGYVDASYYELHAAFGEPERHEGDKVRAEWVLVFSDDTIATIYDWKQYDAPVESVTRWNIGGRTPYAVERVREVLDETFMRLMESNTDFDLDPYAHMDDWNAAG
jgi:hypothetical protein